MTSSKRTRRATNRVPGLLLASLLIVVVGVTVAIGYESLARSSSTPLAFEPLQPESQMARNNVTGSGNVVPGTADGVVPDGVTVFDDEYPAVANLDPDLLSALRSAASNAEAAGITFIVNSGWRSAAYQQQLLNDAIATYGSAEEAARWVASPDTSAHVFGDAVDLGPPEAAAWLAGFGAAYGLCQIYSNEPWHFELRPSAADYGCPPVYLDATYDPRLAR